MPRSAAAALARAPPAPPPPRGMRVTWRGRTGSLRRSGSVSVWAQRRMRRTAAHRRPRETRRPGTRWRQLQLRRAPPQAWASRLHCRREAASELRSSRRWHLVRKTGALARVRAAHAWRSGRRCTRRRDDVALLFCASARSYAVASSPAATPCEQLVTCNLVASRDGGSQRCGSDIDIDAEKTHPPADYKVCSCAASAAPPEVTLSASCAISQVMSAAHASTGAGAPPDGAAWETVISSMRMLWLVHRTLMRRTCTDAFQKS